MLHGGSAADIETCLKVVELTLGKLKGTYGLGIIFRDCPDTVIAVRCGSPLVIGIGKDEYFLASDASPLVGYTKEVVYLSDNEVAVLQPNGLRIDHRKTGSVSPNVHVLERVSADIELDGDEHYMLKEIFEQPQTIENALRGRLDSDEATSVMGGGESDCEGFASRRSDCAHRLRHKLARRTCRRISARRICPCSDGS